MSAPKTSPQWLLRELPTMYLAFCRAASQLDDGAQILHDHIRACREDPAAHAPEPEKDTARGDLKRALRLVNLIAATGWGWLLESLDSALEERRVERTWDGVSLIEEATDRWARFGREGARDLVLLVRGPDRVVSLSSGEVEEASTQTQTALATYRLKNFHYYPGFNRMRAVTGRHLGIRTVADPESYRDAVSCFKPLLKCVRDARLVGQSRALREFVPLGRGEDVRLWAFFALLGHVDAPRQIPAPAGGLLEEVLVKFSDRTGQADLVFHPAVFQRCLGDFESLGFRSPVQYMDDFATWAGSSLVIVGWPFGSAHLSEPLDRPMVVHWFPLSSDKTTDSYDALTRIVSSRKISSHVLDKDYPGWRSLLERGRTGVVEVGEWVYSVPSSLDPRLFRMYIENGMKGVEYTEARAHLGVDIKQVARFLGALNQHLSLSRVGERLYSAEDPDRAMREAYPALELAMVSFPTAETGGGTPSLKGGDTIRVPSSKEDDLSLQPNQVVVNGAILTREGEVYVRVVSMEKRQTPRGLQKVKVRETYDPASGRLVRTCETWLAGSPETTKSVTELSDTRARITARGR